MLRDEQRIGYTDIDNDCVVQAVVKKTTFWKIKKIKINNKKKKNLLTKASVLTEDSSSLPIERIQATD